MKATVTGATGFVGGHVARLLAERGDEVRVTYRDPERLERLEELELKPVKADMLDRAALRRAMKGADAVFHTAGYVASSPVERVWQLNAVAPRVVVEAAAAEGVGRVVLTSSASALGPAPPGEIGHEEQPYRSSGLVYPEAKRQGEIDALLAGARNGVDVVAVLPAYVLGVPVDRTQPGETSTRVVGNYIRGRLPAVIDGETSLVDVEDVARGHLLAAEHGDPGERYLLAGHNLSWVQMIDRIARIARTSHPVVVLPSELSTVARVREALGIPGPVAAEGYDLMGQNWRYSSRRAQRDLGYSFRPLADTLRATIDWYRDLIAAGAFEDGGRSGLSVAAAGMQTADRLGLLAPLRLAERVTGRRFVGGS